MSIDIGASLGMFFGLSMKDAMKSYSELSQSLNLNAVEIRFEKENGRPSLWCSEVNNNLRQFLNQFRKKGVHLPFINLDLISGSHEVRSRSIKILEESIQVASDLNCDYTVMHARGKNINLNSNQAMEEWIHVISEITSFAEDCSVQLTIENADALTNLETLTKIVASIGSQNLKITLDVGHAYSRIITPNLSCPLMDYCFKVIDIVWPRFIINKRMPFEKYGSIYNYIQSEKKRIYNIHLHDNDGFRDHKNIGQGKIDFNFISQAKSFMEGPLIFETDLTNPNDLIGSYHSIMEIME